MKGKHKAGRFNILLKHMNGILSWSDTVFIIKKSEPESIDTREAITMETNEYI